MTLEMLICQILFEWVATYLPFDSQTNADILVQLVPAMEGV